MYHDTQTQDAKRVVVSSIKGGGDARTTAPRKAAYEDEPEVIHVYPVEGGGLLLTKTPLEEDEPPPVIDSVELDAIEETPPPLAPPLAKARPYAPYVLLLVCFFLLFELGDSAVSAFFLPIVTLTVTPWTQTIVTTATISLASLSGRVLPAVTVSQSQTTQTTGKGHQNARQATGRLTFYNGLFTAESVPSGTVLTGSDGVQVVLDHEVIIPPGNPPYYGETNGTAHALRPGSQGNMAAGAIDTSLASGLLVKNNQFTGGQDARDFLYVTQADIQGNVSHLTPHLLQSEQAIFTAQLAAGEALVPPSCTQTVTANHHPGDEATTVQVTVSASCRAVVYRPQAFKQAATQLFSARGVTLNKTYHLGGAINITGLTAHIPEAPTTAAALTVSLRGIWVYTLSERHLTALVSGKPRQEALHLLSQIPGVQSVRIEGVRGNDPLPPSSMYIHIIFLVL